MESAPRAREYRLDNIDMLRGLVIVIEIFLISTAWTFAPGGIEQVRGLVLVPLQVIRAIGASMVALAGLQFLGRRACLLAGLHAQASSALGPFLFVLAYPLLPWISVVVALCPLSRWAAAVKARRRDWWLSYV